ncbi:hypothetical protein [Argonema antarcticum]|uniref:hypothetical protein n=1 Tax=Argonema antarcticum TaxID=2942763 RepID=UPI002011BC5E|nr:hypothetical protein [Argonema antarcticum]MCL1470989.1 hypothetical protein [Argonema antarcticum A004/B2]
MTTVDEPHNLADVFTHTGNVYLYLSIDETILDFGLTPNGREGASNTEKLFFFSQMIERGLKTFFVLGHFLTNGLYITKYIFLQAPMIANIPSF